MIGIIMYINIAVVTPFLPPTQPRLRPQSPGPNKYRSSSSALESRERNGTFVVNSTIIESQMSVSQKFSFRPSLPTS